LKEENKMFKKTSVCFLIIFLLNYLACTSLNVASKDSVKEEIKNGTLHSDIYIITKDNDRYHLGDWGYQIKNDTLYAKGLKVNPNGEEPFDGKIAMDDISHFEVEEGDALATTGLVVGVAAIGLLLFGIIIYNSASNDVKSCSQS
jgi:hypothetical protein